MISMSSGAASAFSNIALASASVMCSSDSSGRELGVEVELVAAVDVAMKARRSRLTVQYIQARGCGMTS